MSICQLDIAGGHLRGAASNLVASQLPADRGTLRCTVVGSLSGLRAGQQQRRGARRGRDQACLRLRGGAWRRHVRRFCGGGSLSCVSVICLARLHCAGNTVLGRAAVRALYMSA